MDEDIPLQEWLLVMDMSPLSVFQRVLYHPMGGRLWFCGCTGTGVSATVGNWDATTSEARRCKNLTQGFSDRGHCNTGS